MASYLQLEDLSIEVTRKAIKHVYLRVNGAGEVRMSAPRRMSNRELEAFARSKLGWIRRQQRKHQDRPKPIDHQYASGERFQVWGRTVHLQVVETGGKPSVEVRGAALRMAVRPGTSKSKRKALLEAWLRSELEAAVPDLLARWEDVVGVKITRVTLRKMKTRWGSCSTGTRRIRLNIELARIDPACLEYVLVHELVHLLEASHNARFKALMDHHLPGWRAVRARLRDHALGRLLY